MVPIKGNDTSFAECRLTELFPTKSAETYNKAMTVALPNRCTCEEQLLVWSDRYRSL